MNRPLEWLLDLRSLHFGDEGVSFGFARPLPTWGWALVMIACGVLAWWSYRRLEGRLAGRIALAALRALLVLLLAVLIAGPRMIRPNETEEKDWVLVLVDRSASMGVRDAPDAGGARSTPITREQQLRAALRAGGPQWKSLAENRVVVWLGFDSSAFDLVASGGAGIAADAGEPVVLGDATGRRTAIARAIDQALRRSAARPVAGIVLFTDGRSSDEASKQLVRRLQAEKIPVLTYPLGSTEPLADLALRSVRAPQAAFLRDMVPVEVEIERLGGDPAGAGANEPWGDIELVDRATGLVLDRREIPSTPAPAAPNPSVSADPRDDAKPARPVDRSQRMTLTARPGAGQQGASSWLVRIVPRRADLVPENNEQTLDLSLEDRPLRIAYFDGYPRWEYRYVKNLLVREKSISSVSLLLAEGRRFVQEGDETMFVLPNSPEEWRAYDVIVMGDVHPDVFTEEQLAQIREHVAVDGAGLLWIGGESATPGAWAPTGLADLLPFSVRRASGGGSASEGDSIRSWVEPIMVRPTGLAERYGVLRLSDSELMDADPSLRWWPHDLRDPSVGWSRLRWAQRIDPASLKPAAEVLAEAYPESAAADAGASGERSPLVTSMRFGAGRVVYIATDEIWRWRFGRGEDLPERFWLQVIRMLGRESLSRAGKVARLQANPVRAELEQPVRVSLDLFDQRLIDSAGATVQARVVRDEAGASTVAAELTLAREGGTGAARQSRAFVATFVPSEAGKYRIETADPLLAGERLIAPLEVWLPDDELRNPATNHQALTDLAQATDGKVLGIEDLSRLSQLLPNRRVRVVGTPEEESLWDTPLAMILLVGLLTAEWIGRRVLRLS